MDALMDKVIEAAKSGDIAALQTLLPPGSARRNLVPQQQKQQQGQQGQQEAVEGQEEQQQQQQDGEGDGWAESHHGATPAHYAARGGRLGALRYLVEEAGLPGRTRALNGATPAHDAAATGHLACLQWLLTNGGCRPEDKDASGATVLHLAARFGRRSVAQWLLQGGGSDPLGATASGALALHYAVARGDLPTLQLLLAKAPQTLNSRTGAGATPLYLACQEGHLDCLQFLATECGAETGVRATDGMTAMHAAAQMGHATVIVWLVSSTALRLSDTDADGATAMHFAASRGHGTVLSWLLLHGGEPVRDAWGGTPLHDAAENGHLQCCQILVVNGVDLRVRDNDGCTAADLAESNGHARCAKYLRTVENMSPENRILAREYSLEGLEVTDPDRPSANASANRDAVAAADLSTFDPDAGAPADRSGGGVDGSAILQAYLDLLDPDERAAALAGARADGGGGAAGPAPPRDGARAERVDPVQVLQRKRSELRPVLTQGPPGGCAPDNVSPEELSQARLRRVDSNRKTRTFGKQPSTSDYYKSFSMERDEVGDCGDGGGGGGGGGGRAEPSPAHNGEDHSGAAETPDPEPEPEPPSPPPSLSPDAVFDEDAETPPAPPPAPPAPPVPPAPPAPPAPPPPPPLSLPGEPPRFGDGDHSRPPSAASSVKSFNMLSPNGDNSDLLAEIKAGRNLKPTHPGKGCTTVFIGSAHLNQRPISPDYQPQGSGSGGDAEGTNGDGGFARGAGAGGRGSSGGSSSGGSSGGVGGAGETLARLDSLDVDALVPLQDEQGRPIPEWKRQVMVRKLQTRLQQEEEQRRQVLEETERLANLPAWRREIVRKKLEDEKERKRMEEETERQKQESMQRLQSERIQQLGYDEEKLAPWQRQLILRKGDITKN